MLEYLMGYVDKLEGEFEQLGANQVHKDTKMVNGRYETLMAMKKFIMDDMVPHFIDEDIRYLRLVEKPTRDLVSTTIKRWEEFCDKYPDYLNKKKIRDYMVGQLIQEQ